jgi:hypothetical protein
MPWPVLRNRAATPSTSSELSYRRCGWPPCAALAQAAREGQAQGRPFNSIGTLTRLRRLMGAYIARDEDHGRNPRTVREFISEFRGLSGSAKQKAALEETGAARLSLPEFFGNGDSVNHDRIAVLLEAMQWHSRPVKPADLGLIGKDHLAQRMRAAGVNMGTSASATRRVCPS